jgi:hypothetical protein
VPSAKTDIKKLPNGGVYNTVSFHAYNYSNNNPVNYTDPNGEIPVLAILIGLAAITTVVTTIMAMLPHRGDGFLYFDTWQPQRLGGFHNWYTNFTSNRGVCNIDTYRIDFQRAKGGNASIWFWKGDYKMVINGGWHTGAEIGTYNGLGGVTSSVLESASFTLKDSDGNILANRYLNGKWWINSFVKGNGDGRTSGANGAPGSLKMNAMLGFYNESDAASFEAAVGGGRYFPSLNEDGSKRDKEDVYINVRRNGKMVEVEFQ